jgi:hypothetical protein
MRSDIITVTSKNVGIDQALEMTESISSENGLEKKQKLHMRLLAEELFGLLKGIAGDVEADYWIEVTGKKFDVHMKSEVRLTDEMKKQFLESSSTGENAAAKGVMGKIRVLIASALLSTKEVLPMALINTAAAYQPAGGAGASVDWSMVDYRNHIKKENGNNETAEAWDELEKSIIANIADDVKVKILGNKVEIIVFKNFE